LRRPGSSNAQRATGTGEFTTELRVITEGEDHKASFLNYFRTGFTGTAPWSVFVAAALVEAARRWRSDWRLRGC
jgi:hypothetical protein